MNAEVLLEFLLGILLAPAGGEVDATVADPCEPPAQ